MILNLEYRICLKRERTCKIFRHFFGYTIYSFLALPKIHFSFNFYIHHVDTFIFPEMILATQISYCIFVASEDVFNVGVKDV